VTATLQVGESRPQSAALIQADQYNKWTTNFFFKKKCCIGTDKWNDALSYLKSNLLGMFVTLQDIEA
jgi:hypothetical protein